MSLYRFLCAGLVSVLLAGCGFQPLYYRDGVRSSIKEDLASIYVRPISDRIGQELRTELNDVLSPSRASVPDKWELDIKLQEATQKIALESTTFSTRANLIVTATISLVPKLEGETRKATIKAISSYNLVDSEYANVIAERDARSRAVVNLSSDIRRTLALWLRKDEG